MRRLILITIYLITVVFNASAQKTTTDTSVEKCDFLKPLIFKNEKAIIVVKTTYKYIFRSPEEGLFRKLEKKKILRYKDYFSSCCGGSEINFIPENCSKDYHATMREKLPFDINKVRQGETLYLTFTVFKNEYSFDRMPFFIISGISLKNPKSD